MNTENTFYQVQEILSSVRITLANLLVKHPKTILYSMITCMVTLSLLAVLLHAGPSVSAQSDHVNHKYFTTIEVTAGDTLWDIAEEYRSAEYADVQEYIDEIKEINHINGNDITAGCYITVPYYSEEPMK